MTYGVAMIDELLVLVRDPNAWAALATLVVMEIVLGIDNLIFISILTNKLPEHQQSNARRLGIGLAVLMRLALLGTVAFIVQLTQPLFTLLDHAFSWRDLILIAGGLFLIWKATTDTSSSGGTLPTGNSLRESSGNTRSKRWRISPPRVMWTAASSGPASS